MHIRCTLCNDLVIGPAYGCVECGNYLHISCAVFPLEIQHPYHSQHPLRASTTTSDEQWSFRCKACRELVGIAVYQCRPCGLALDIICANQTLLSSPLKHECHQHNLHYIIGSDDGGDEEKEDTSGESDDKEDEDGGSDDGEVEDTDDSTDDGEEDTDEASDDGEDDDPDEESDDEEEEDDDAKKCIACNKYCVKSYYQCLECKFFTHHKCMGFPTTLDHGCHFHPLTLVDKFAEDDSGVNCCHACRQKRNPDYPVCLYQDKECLDKAPYVAHIECVVSKILTLNAHSATFTLNPPLISFYIANSPGSYGKRSADGGIKHFENDHALTCYERGTTLWFDETCYGCNRHPLHSQHPLTILPPNDTEAILCDGCGNFTFDGGYKCDGCQFMLDTKCASLNIDQFQNSQHRKISISHPFHDHKLTLTSHNVQEDCTCFACQVPILSTPCYTCLPCQVLFQERCLEIPQERQHPYHPQHPLLIKNLYGSHRPCRACKLIIKGLGYHCNQCGFILCRLCNIHSQIQKGSHQFFLDMVQLMTKAHSNAKFVSEQCFGWFYRCVKCDMNYHFDCLSIPHKVNHQCQMDPLILADSMNPNHGVYQCKECMVIAHIGCVLEE
ncbi:hypothetical protein Tsubulata_043399, partial [Turnera subulata]